MGLSELMYVVGSLAVTAAIWFGIYWVIRRSTAAGVREGAQTELLRRELDAAQGEVRDLRRRVEELERSDEREG